MANELLKIKDEDVKKAYARWAPVYDITFGKIARAGRIRAVDHINTSSGKVLEVGVGTGISLPHYQTHLNITGIDLSPDMLAVADKRVKAEQLSHVDAINEMDAGAMSFEAESFETVVAMYVMTVVPDPQKVMSELARVCKPGGEVILVNHFSQTSGIRGLVEKMADRFGSKLGWRPIFPVETVMGCENLVLVDMHTIRPLGLFSMMRFKKLPDQEVMTKSDDARQDETVTGLHVA